MEPLDNILKKIEGFKRDLSAEIVIQEEISHTDERLDTDGSEIYGSYTVTIIDQPRIAEPDAKKREAAVKGLQEISANFNWFDENNNPIKVALDYAFGWDNVLHAVHNQAKSLASEVLASKYLTHDQLKKVYYFSDSHESMKIAGEKLGHSKTRIWLHQHWDGIGLGIGCLGISFFVLMGLGVADYASGKYQKTQASSAAVIEQKDADTVSLPLETLLLQTHSETSGEKASEPQHLTVEKLEDSVRMDYNVTKYRSHTAQYVWADIDINKINMTLMKYLYLKVKGGETHPEKVKLELVAENTETKEKKRGAYVIGDYYGEKITSDKWLELEIPMYRLTAGGDSIDPNMKYPGIPFEDMKNVKYLTFVFSDTFARDCPKGTVFVKDIVFSKEKLDKE